MVKPVTGKFYEVVFRYHPGLDLVTSNSFIYYADKKPQASVEMDGSALVRRVYFEDPVEAEDYRQRAMANKGGFENEDYQQGRV